MTAGLSPLADQTARVIVGEIPVAAEAELARLRAENVRLLKLLRLSPQQAAPPGPAQGAFFEAAPGIVHHRSPQDAKVAFFGALFAARTDVYAVRYDNAHAGKGGWIPAVRGGWRKGVRHEDRNYLPLTAAVLAAHVKGSASFHHDSRRDSPSSDIARETTTKISFKPTDQSGGATGRSGAAPAHP